MPARPPAPLTPSRRALLAGVLALAAAPALPRPAAAQSATPLASPFARPPARPHPDWLVDPAWVADRQERPNARVVALQPAADFAKGHVPGAVQIDYPALDLDDSSTAGLAKWGTATRKRIGELGLAQGQSIVVYDDGTLFSARLWWVLRYLGHTEVRMLNGGWAAWQAAHGKAATGPAAPVDLGAYRGPTDPRLLAPVTLVAAAVKAGSAVLVDVRSPQEYAAGHVPGAVNVPYTDNADPAPLAMWRPAADLSRLYAAAGVTPDRPVIAYCSTGVRSAVTVFTLRMLGYPDVRLFSGSWREWTADPKRPVTTGPHP